VNSTSDPDLLNAVNRLTAELARFNNALYSIGTDQLLVRSTALASPQSVDDWSATVAQMQRTRDPYPAGAPSLATDLAEELESIRYVLEQLSGAAQWYVDPATSIAALNTILNAHAARHAPGAADPLTVGTPSSITAGGANAEGASTEFVRKDHIHGATVGTPSPVDATAAEGSSEEFVRKDHVHRGLDTDPDYDSGWVAIARGGSATKTHDLGTANLLVENTCKDGANIGNQRIGRSYYGIPNQGASGFWFDNLTTTQVRLVRGPKEYYIDSFRVRIWKMA